MMTDEEFMEQCTAYLDGALTADEAAEFLAVTHSNPSFHNLLSDLQQAYSTVDSALKQHALIEPPMGLSERIERALEADYPAPRVSNVIPMSAHRRNRPFQMKAVAAVLLLLFAGLVPMYFQQQTIQANQTRELGHKVQSVWSELDELNHNADDTLDLSSFSNS